MVVMIVAITPRIKQYGAARLRSIDRRRSGVDGNPNGAETIKAMGIERAIWLKWEQKYAKVLNVKYKAQGFEGIDRLRQSVLHAVTVTSVLWVGANLVLGQQLTIGQLIAFNMLMGSDGAAHGPDRCGRAARSRGGDERLGDVLDMSREQKPEDQPSRILLPSLRAIYPSARRVFPLRWQGDPMFWKTSASELKAGETVARRSPAAPARPRWASCW